MPILGYTRVSQVLLPKLLHGFFDRPLHPFCIAMEAKNRITVVADPEASSNIETLCRCHRSRVYLLALSAACRLGFYWGGCQHKFGSCVTSATDFGWSTTVLSMCGRVVFGTSIQWQTCLPCSHSDIALTDDRCKKCIEAKATTCANDVLVEIITWCRRFARDTFLPILCRIDKAFFAFRCLSRNFLQGHMLSDHSSLVGTPGECCAPFAPGLSVQGRLRF